MSITANKVENPCKVVTGVVRLSYANIWQPKSIKDGTPKYSTSVLIPKNDAVTVGKIKAAVEAAYREGENKLRGNAKSVPPLAAIKTPLRDGDLERPDDDAYKGCWFLNANSTTVTDTSKIYSGVYARVSLAFFAYSTNGNRGVAAGLQNIQKVRDGERLGGRARAEDDFDDNFVDDYVPDDDFLA